MKTKSFSAVIGESFRAFSNNWGEIIGAYILSMGTLFGLMLFPAFGFFLAFFAMGFLCVGQKRFVLSRLSGKREPIEVVFSYYRYSIGDFCTKTLIILFSLLWGLLLIVPGIICLLNYSFASFILAERPNLSALEVLEESKKLTYGHRSKIFFLGIFALLMALALGAIGFCISLLIGLAVTLPVWATVLMTVLPFLFGFLLLAMPFYEISSAKIYLEAKPEEQKPARRSKQLTQKADE